MRQKPAERCLIEMMLVVAELDVTFKLDMVTEIHPGLSIEGRLLIPISLTDRNSK